MIDPYWSFGGTANNKTREFLQVNIYLEEFQEAVSEKHGKVLHNRIFHGGTKFEFINSIDFNAISFIHNNCEYIGINIGLVNTLRIFTKAVFSDANVFGDVGQAGQPELAHQLRRILVSSKPLNLIDPKTISLGDETREALAETMVFLCCAHVLHHELGHISRCHIPFISKEDFTTTAIKEIEHFGLTPSEAQTRRFLELDADGYGNTFSYSACQRLAASDRFPEICEENFQEFWGASIYLLFSLMSLHSSSHRRNVKSIHPDPDVRLAFAMLSAVTENIGPKGKADWARIVDGTEQVSRWWSGEGLPTEFLHGRWDEAVEEAIALRNLIAENEEHLEGIHKRRLENYS